MWCFFGGDERSGVGVSDSQSFGSGNVFLLLVALLKIGTGWDDLCRGGSEGTILFFLRRGGALVIGMNVAERGDIKFWGEGELGGGGKLSGIDVMGGNEVWWGEGHDDVCCSFLVFGSSVCGGGRSPAGAERVGDGAQCSSGSCLAGVLRELVKAPKGHCSVVGLAMGGGRKCSERWNSSKRFSVMGGGI